MLALLIGLCAAVEARSEQPAYMEAGLGVVGQFVANYRGSSHYQVKALPVPYFLYYGRIIKSDGRGVRGDFVTGTRFELSLSLDGSLGGESDQWDLRRGMPELATSFELGPSLNLRLTGLNFDHGWSVNLPVRAVVAVDASGIEHIGFLSAPRLTWRHPNLYEQWRVSVGVGVVLANDDYHAYYYEVAPEYVTPHRPEYRAEGGYNGAFGRLALYKHFDSWRLAFALRYDNLSGTAFADSPLVETEHFASFSLAVAKTVWTSR